MFADQLHGSLQNDDAVLDHVTAVIQGLDLEVAAYRFEFKVALDIADAYEANAPVTLRAKTEPAVYTLELDLYDANQTAGEDNVRLDRITLRDRGDGELLGEVQLDEGAYRVVVARAASIAPAADCFLVLNGRQ
jgi:hypothetical protein